MKSSIRELSSEEIAMISGGNSPLKCGLAVAGGYYGGGTAGAIGLGGIGAKVGGLKGAVAGGIIGWIGGAIGGAATAAANSCFDK